MNRKALATYLNDHLAGSVVVIDLLEHLTSAYAGSDAEPFIQTLRDEIISDRKVLEQLMADLEIKQSKSRRASAWVGEKLAELKLRLDDPQASEFRLFQSMEAVSLGLEGQRSLWRALQTASEQDTELQRADFQKMERVAAEQRSRVEEMRLKLAAAALISRVR